MNKKGITLVSIVVYVALFFGFMTFATIISTNMNYTSLSYKGKILNIENFKKLEQNMINSAKSSTSVDDIGGNIVFSNNDEYEYNSDKKAILKNGGVLISNVTDFKVITVDKLNNVPEYFLRKENGEYANIDTTKDYICLEISFEKYGVQTTSQLFVTVGDEINEEI